MHLASSESEVSKLCPCPLIDTRFLLVAATLLQATGQYLSGFDAARQTMKSWTSGVREGTALRRPCPSAN
jgi:hypothetical protein